MSRIGINGFGRVGRMLLRAAFDSCAFVVAINEPDLELEYMVYLLKHDSTHGPFEGKIVVVDDALMINKHKITVFHEREAAHIGWESAGAEYIVECSGMFDTIDMASAHFNGGAKKVIICAPSPDAPSFVMGINMENYTSDMTIVSNCSSATHCLAPLLKVLDDNFGIVEALATTIHSYTAFQKTVDGGIGSNWRLSRGGAQNIIPLDTDTAMSTTKILPELSNKLEVIAFHVPVPNVCVIDLTVHFLNAAPYQAITEKIREASENAYKSIIQYVEDEMVSTDFTGNKASCVFDSKAGVPLNENFVKLVAWYDNEVAYAYRTIELVKYMQKEDNPW